MSGAIIEAIKAVTRLGRGGIEKMIQRWERDPVLAGHELAFYAALARHRSTVMLHKRDNARMKKLLWRWRDNRSARMASAAKEIEGFALRFEKEGVTCLRAAPAIEGAA